MNKKHRVFKMRGYTVTDWTPIKSFDTQEEAEKFIETCDQPGTYIILTIYEKTA